MKTKYIIVETDSMSPYLISYNKLILILFCNFYIFKKFHNLEFDKNVTYIAGLVHILPLGAGPLIYLNSNMSITVILAPYRGFSNSRLNSDAPGKLMDHQNVTTFWHF